MFSGSTMADQVSTRQKRLAALLRATSSTIRVNDAMKALNVERQKASQLLAGWHKQGAIRRVAHGLYVPVQPSALGQTQVLEDPWILAPELYRPCYIGGWTALEHWELTEQLFRTVCVLSNKRTSYGETSHQGVSFFIKYVPEKSLFGTKTIWRNQVKVQISDPHKTVLDIIDDLRLGAGLQHTLDCLKEYSKMFSSPNDRAQLLKYATRLNNGALFKKLGYFSEKLAFEKEFVDECRKHITKGYAILDRESGQHKLITRWKLWVPRDW